MTYEEFVFDFWKLKKECQSYRLGQHFINLFVKNESTDPDLLGLWQKDGIEAEKHIAKIIEKYQWDDNNLKRV